MSATILFDRCGLGNKRPRETWSIGRRKWQEISSYTGNNRADFFCSPYLFSGGDPFESTFPFEYVLKLTVGHPRYGTAINLQAKLPSRKQFQCKVHMRDCPLPSYLARHLFQVSERRKLPVQTHARYSFPYPENEASTLPAVGGPACRLRAALSRSNATRAGGA